MEDKEIINYINESFTEEVIVQYENQILKIMKSRFEKYPSERNDLEWLDYSNYICKRRCQRNAEKNTSGAL